MAAKKKQAKRKPAELKGKAAKALVSWREFLKYLNNLNAEELEQCLEHELVNKRRKRVLERLGERLRRVQSVNARKLLESRIK